VSGGGRVSELRLVVTAADHQSALRFYGDVLGLREQESFDANGGHVTILDAGRATFEINDPPYAEYIDEVEVGTRVAGHIRVCFEVEGAGRRVGQRFASAVSAWSTTAWGSAAPAR
jgi:lactoylglutathione lyase